VAELGQRTAPQPDHQHMSRLGHEQQEGHHFARVGKFEGERIVDAHGALDEIQTEQQLPRLAVVDDERPVVAAVHDPFIQRLRSLCAGSSTRTLTSPPDTLPGNSSSGRVLGR